MTPRMLIGSLALAVTSAAASPAAAQDVTAEVRTWSGQSLQLAQPSLEVFYTIVPREEGPGGGGQQYPGAAAGGSPGAMGSGTSTGSLVGTEISGSIRNLSRLFTDKGPEPLQGNRQAVSVSLTQAGVDIEVLFDNGVLTLKGEKRSETEDKDRQFSERYYGRFERRIPLEAIKDLAFRRIQVSGSTLPPYVAPTHFRYAASALLTDGSRVDGDYVNLGSAVLRGLTPQGRVEVPWQDIEVVRFSR